MVETLPKSWIYWTRFDQGISRTGINSGKDLADRVLATIDKSKLEKYSPFTSRDVFFRASRYYFTADFSLHGNRKDPRLSENYKIWRSLFDKGNACLQNPGKHVTIATSHGFSVKAIVYKATSSSASNPRPTLIAGRGFDSNLEEMYHVFAVPALEREYNIIIYEGPGHRGLIEEQKKGFIYDWEKVVTPIVDHIFEHSSDELSFIDPKKLGLIGYSMGGYLSARAAAFEPRLAALIAVDGVYDFAESTFSFLSELKEPFQTGDRDKFNAIFDQINEQSSTNNRWFHDQLKYSFMDDDAFDLYKNQVSKMTIKDIAGQIKMPTFFGDASRDIFFLGQPPRVAKAIGDNATLWSFDDKSSSGAHCQSGALVYLNQSLLEWFSDVVGK